MGTPRQLSNIGKQSERGIAGEDETEREDQKTKLRVDVKEISISTLCRVSNSQR